MAKHNEQDFIIPAIKVIDSHNGACTTAIIKEEIYKFINLSPEDLVKSDTRNEPKYKQIVGNLISHKSKELFKYINIITEKDEKGNTTSKNLLCLNEEGIKLANSFKNISRSTIVSEVSIADFILDEPLIDDQDKKVIDATNKNNLKKRMNTDKSLSDTVNKLNNYECQYAKLIGEHHQTQTNGNGVPICNAHHLIPMKATFDFFPRNLDRASNLVTVCPNCHSALHNGAPDVKRRMLKVLYDKYIDGLNREDIYISFEDLLNKYY